MGAPREISGGPHLPLPRHCHEDTIKVKNSVQFGTHDWWQTYSHFFLYYIANKFWYTQNQAIISIILLQNVETFVPEFIEILPEFSTNQNFWGCPCIPCTPASYTTAMKERRFAIPAEEVAILAFPVAPKCQL